MQRPSRGSIRFDCGRDRRPAEPPHLRSRHRPGRRGAADLPDHERARESRDGRRDQAGAARAAAIARARLCALPAPRRAAPPGRRHAVGRRAADAGDRPLPDGPAAPRHVRRALARPRPAGRARRLRHHPPAQPRGGADHRPRRAERRPLAQPRRSRLRAGERQRRKLRGSGKDLLADDRVRQAYIGL